MSLARLPCPALAAALVVTAAASLATAKRLPTPPPARSLTCKSQASANHESAVIEAKSDGMHVILAADHKLGTWWKFDFPKDKAHKVLRGIATGGSLEVVFPLAQCQFGRTVGLVSCVSPDAPVRATVSYTDKRRKPATATLDLVTASITTSRIETTTVADGTTTSWQVQLAWGGTASSAATATATFGPQDSCTAL